MPEKKPKVSIIIVHYRAKKELFDCINSIYASKPKISYEIIVVDNDEQKIIKKELLKKFPFIDYVESKGNIGFGAGNNLGASYASGQLLFFVNPDTLIFPETLDRLVNFILKNKQIGIVAPLVVDIKKKPYRLQGSLQLTPLEGVVVLSFINKYFPDNPIARRYMLASWNKKDAEEVDVIAGCAFVILKNVFEEIRGFDERFFLFFEEADLCRRVKNLGYKIWINPRAKIVHLGAKSTRQSEKIEKIFSQSRFYYFRKHFGMAAAVIVHLVSSIKNPVKYLGI